MQSFSTNVSTSCIDEKHMGFEYDLEIIVPAYNVEKYIAQCIESIIGQQTEYRWHLVVIDDGSTDNTGMLLDRYKSENISIIHQQNMGFSGARNRGLHISNGKYIMFVDSDDFIPKGTIQNLLDYACKTDADIVWGGYEIFSEDGYKKVIMGEQGKTGTMDLLNGMPWGKIYKASLFKNISFPIGYWYEDSIMKQIIYPLAKNIYGIKQSVYCWRINPKGITSTSVKNNKCIDSLYITIQLYKDREILGLEKNQSYYEYILRMVRLTYLRTRLMPLKVKKSIFIVFANFIEKEFEYYKSNNYIDLEYALKHRKYEMYTKYCEK